MKLTTMSRYGTRAIFDIASTSTGFPVQVKEYLLQGSKFLIKYLEQIFHKLKKADFIKSERGPGGGYVLTKVPSEITMEISSEQSEKIRTSYPVFATRLRTVNPVSGKTCVLQELFGKKQLDRLLITLTL